MKNTHSTIIMLAALLASGLGAEPRPANLALNKPATASSEQSATRAAAMANDDNLWTRWCAKEETAGQWWQVDLQTPTQIAACEIVWEKDNQPYQYIVEGSLDGQTWTTLSDQSASTDARQTRAHQFPASSARHVRVRVTTLPARCSASIYEVRLFATAPVVEPAPAVAPVAATTAAPVAKPAPVAAERPAKPAAAPAASKPGEIELQPGKTVEMELPLPSDCAKTLATFYGEPTTKMKMAIAVPSDFDPAKHQRVLFVSASTSGDGLSIKQMRTYTAAALARGWIVMAADGEMGKPKIDNIYFRGNLLELMEDWLTKRWPQSKTKWSIATAGFSGGAGYASDQAVFLCGQGWHMIGMLLMNGGYSPVDWEKDKYVKGPRSAFHQIPVFISAGETDNVAKPDIMRSTIARTKSGGYKTMRVEWHPGAHQVCKEHITTALEWFESFDK